MNETIVTYEGISKSFFGIRALRDVSGTLRRGRVLGLVGENGAGKSTLMNILGGVVPPDAGSMTLHGSPYMPRRPADATRAGIAFIHQELNLFPNLSIADNIFIDRFPRIPGLPFIHRRALYRKTRDALAQVDLHISPGTPVENLAPGERQLVEIAKALSVGAEIIIFDEPTTSLTTRETDRLFHLIGQLRHAGKSIVFISHTLRDVLKVADDIAVLRDGMFVSAGARCEFTINTMISLMAGREIDNLYPPRTSQPTKDVALEVTALRQYGIIHDVSFTVHRGEVVGLFGLMGSGRSELARILFGLDTYETGRIRLHGRALPPLRPRESIRRGMAFLTENRREEGLLMEASLLDNVTLAALGQYAPTPLVRFLNARRLRTTSQSVVTSLRIKSGAIHRDLAKNLSGGNQQKVVIGKWMLSEPSVFLMDEPTRGIDVGAKYDVYKLINDLASRGTAVLCISSELEELMGICDRILVMHSGEIRGEFRPADASEEHILRCAFGEMDHN